MNIAVLASGAGSTLQAVIDATLSGELQARVVLVISNNSKSGALQRARNHDITALHISNATHPGDNLRDRAISDACAEADVDLVLLAGYLKQLGPVMMERFKGRMINTHPSLLPKFGGQGYFGARVHEAVLAAGETETGATVHMVTEEYDDGPIVGQVAVPVLPDDTLETLQNRVQNAEKKLLIEVLKEWQIRPATKDLESQT